MKKRPTYEELQNKIKLMEDELLNQKKLQQNIDKEKYYLDQAQKIGKFGTWEYDVIDESIFWTPENYKIFEIPEDTTVTSRLIMELVHPDDRDSTFLYQYSAGVFSGCAVHLPAALSYSATLHWSVFFSYRSSRR
jgi:hypothetical protein